MHPIGVIHSPFMEKDQTPIQASRSTGHRPGGDLPRVRRWIAGHRRLSNIIILYAFHNSSGFSLLRQTFFGRSGTWPVCHTLSLPSEPDRALSCETHFPSRRIRLTVEGVDVLDGTPLLDIKPFVPEFDLRSQLPVPAGMKHGAKSETPGPLYDPPGWHPSVHSRLFVNGSCTDALPVVHAVLFYSPTCPHCQYVITETLPPLMEKYGNQLQIMGVDVTQPKGRCSSSLPCKNLAWKRAVFHSW